MACSAITLSAATISAVIAVACLAIAFGTDNWYEVRVNQEGNERLANLQEVESDIRYFNRDEGLFRICFPDKKPKGVPTYMSPVQTQCLNIDYYINDEGISDNFSEERWMRLHMARSVIAMFIVAFLFVFLSFFTGIAGCWKRSYSNVIATGFLQMLAAMVDAGAMGLWHGIPHFEYEKLQYPEMPFNRWPAVLKQYSKFYYGWSYILAWIGVGLTLMTAILFLCGARCLRQEKKDDHNKSMQYLMPVYPDKRQPYGYSYAYPNPYYYPNSVYGPYNY